MSALAKPLLVIRHLDDPSATVVRAKAESAKFHSVFEGDGVSGHYRIRTPLGGIDGTYAVTPENVVTFSIEDKSRLIPAALIERVMDEFLGSTGRKVR